MSMSNYTEKELLPAAVEVINNHPGGIDTQKLIRELRSNRRFIERQNPLAEQARRSIEEAMKVPFPDEDDELSDMTYDDENYVYYGNKERLS